MILYSYWISIIGGTGLGKTYVLLNLIKNKRQDIDKIYLHAKDPFESKYRLPVKHFPLGQRVLKQFELKNQARKIAIIYKLYH